MSKQKLYFGGLPTDIEVRKLTENYPVDDLEFGTIIDHSDVEELVHVPRKTSRYRSITTRWRRNMERSHGIIIGCCPEGFKVLDNTEKLNLSTDKLRTSARMARRSYVVASRVDASKLDGQELREYDHNIKRSSSIMQVARLQSKTPLPDIG